MHNLLCVGTWQSGRVSRTAKFFLSRLPDSAVLYLIDTPPFEALNKYLFDQTRRKIQIIACPPLVYNDLLHAVGHVNIYCDHTSGKPTSQSLTEWGEEHPEAYPVALLTEYALQHVDEVHLFGSALQRPAFRVWSRAVANNVLVSRAGLDT